jgi:bacterioferritin (cytochrome b1)
VDFIETQLGLIDRIGEPNWGQLNAEPTSEVES